MAFCGNPPQEDFVCVWGNIVAVDVAKTPVDFIRTVITIKPDSGRISFRGFSGGPVVARDGGVIGMVQLQDDLGYVYAIRTEEILTYLENAK